MRGVASVVVVFYHASSHGIGWLPRFGYLAVDLFFVLSGFVLAYANDRRFSSGEQTFLTFMRGRIRRLAPLFFVGILLGALAIVVVGIASDLQGSRLLGALLMNAIGLPAVLSGSAAAFPIDPPLWSIFFELWVANVVFGLFWKQLRGWPLYLLIIVSAVGLLFAEKRWYTINVGWSIATLGGGFLRVGFSFFVGVAVARFHAAHASKLRFPSVVVLIAMAGILLAPLENRLAHLFELVVVLFIFPALIYFGAEAFEFRPEVGKLFGDTSYALYTIHLPIVTSVALIGSHWPLIHSLGIQIALVCLLFILAMITAWADSKFRTRRRAAIYRGA